MLRLKTLGGLSLVSDRHGPLGGAAAQRRRLAVLAILATARERGVTRDKLVGLLWPEATETRARSALSQALYALKRDTGEEDLVTGYERLVLNLEVVTADVIEFEDALSRQDAALAANLYAGPFLDGVFLDSAPEFEHWLDDVRLRLGQAAERAIERLAADAQKDQDYSAAADWWRRLRQIDPLKTRAIVGLMAALAESGDRAGALRQAESYIRRVREELDGEPSAAVAEYAEALRGSLADQRFIERFVIERELGRGGMAVVYLARDTKHDRQVALKMLHPDMSAAIGRERLEREIRIMARLQHPHILPLHDSSEWADNLYYVMPFVDGESLRARLDRERQLPIDATITIAAEVAEALDYAHRHGVVHLDVKPGNILLAERHAIVADFGIARLASDSIETGNARDGVTLGTPAYMAPEQIRGEPDLDSASDVFSLGCVVYEMLAGRPPWIGASVQAVLAQREVDDPPPLGVVRADAPGWLCDLVRRILAKQPTSRPTADEVLKLLTTAGVPPTTNLPAMGTEIIGREDELRTGCALLRRPDVALLTLTGAGGTGKTRLAVQMALELSSQFERVLFVDLSAVRQPDGVLPAIAASTGVQPQAGREQVEAITSAFAGHRALIVIDNFEQVIGAAPLVARLVGAAPNLKFLVTSRMRLGIRAEHDFFLSPLSIPNEAASPAALRDNPAVRLFVRRAVEANGGIQFDDDTLRAVADICVRLDGLPLGIELAAARCRLMSPRAIAARLEVGLDILSGGSRDMPQRHRTIRQAIAWSLALLGPRERRTFGRMAVFSGGCTLAAAEAVCGDDDAHDTLDTIGALLDASLLMRDAAAREEPRFRMLETVRELALETLAGDPEADQIAARHAAWYSRLAISLAPALTGVTQREALATLASEHANVAVALERSISRADSESALAFGDALWRYWLIRGYLAEGRALLARILALPDAGAPHFSALRANVMSGAGHLAQNSGAVGEAAACFESVLETRRRIGDRAGVAQTLADLGWVAWRRCNFPEAKRLSNECLTLAEELGETRIAALALTNLGAAALFEGSFGEACMSFERSAELRERVADRRGVAFAHSFLAWALCRGGRLHDARELLERAEETLQALGDERLGYLAGDIRAEVLLRSGEAERAAEILAIDSISGVRRFGDRWSVAHGLALASWASRLLGRVERAVTFAQESLELRRAEGDRYGEAESLALLASATRARGDDATATELLHLSRGIRAEIGDAAGLAECDDELAHLAPA